MTGTDLSAALSNSLSLGSILILTALGLAITFGVMRVINMAHGDMLMLGAYTGFVVSAPQYLALNLFWAIPISFLVVGLVGYLMEVCLIRFLYRRPLDTLLATWGVGMVLQETVKLIFGANLQETHLPDSLQGGWVIGDLTIPVYRVFILGITVLCLLAVYLWFYHTSFGLKIRAVVQNRSMASAMGISTRRVDSMTFAFATGLAGVAGCILAHLYNIKYNMGADYIVEAFMVVILGGMGQLSGSVAGGALIGTGDSFIAKILSTSWVERAAVWLGIPQEDWGRIVGNNSEIVAKVLVLLMVIGFILIRPSGLFASKERTYD
jgi:urea transport system permease protein